MGHIIALTDGTYETINTIDDALRAIEARLGREIVSELYEFMTDQE